mmetsp:Transcript_11303/g.18193  ORF Transcript_11303/g.18193 Transcript_11303/m.18193 type:complete len:112 (-) Transcript_11303:41-376(-)
MTKSSGRLSPQGQESSPDSRQAAARWNRRAAGQRQQPQQGLPELPFTLSPYSFHAQNGAVGERLSVSLAQATTDIDRVIAVLDAALDIVRDVDGNNDHSMVVPSFDGPSQN